MQTNSEAKQVGWFRPIYYFIPPMASLLMCLVAAYFYATKRTDAYAATAAGSALTAVVMLITAVREYKAWMFNYALRDVYMSYAGALEKILTTPDTPEPSRYSQIGGIPSSAYQVTEDDLEDVLRSNALADPYRQGTKSIRLIAQEVFGKLDFDAIEQAALFGDTLDEQTDYANDDIARQLRVMGVLEPLQPNIGKVHLRDATASPDDFAMSVND